MTVPPQPAAKKWRKWVEPPRLRLAFERLEIEACLREGLTPVLARASRTLLDELTSAFRRDWPGVRDDPPDWATPFALLYRLLVFLRHELDQRQDLIRRLRLDYADYNRRYLGAVTAEERQHHMLAFAKTLGASRRRLAGDRAAFQRWLGHDTLVERYQRRHAAHDRRLAFALERLGVIGARLLEKAGPSQGHGLLWPRLELEPLLLPLLAYDGDARVRVAAFRALARTLRALPGDQRELPVSEGALRYIYGSALDQRRMTWIQAEALALLPHLDLPSLATALKARLDRPGTGDDLFVRRRAVLLLGEYLERLPELVALLPVVLQDPSPYVRQGLAEALPAMPAATALPAWRELLLSDPVPPVRAVALLQVTSLLVEPTSFDSLLEGVATALGQERDAWVARVALQVIWQVQRQLLADGREAEADRWTMGLLPAVAHLHGHAADPATRRWAAQARERLWAWADPQRRRWLAALAEEVAAVPAGRRRRLSRALATVGDATLGRLLALLAQDDHGCTVARGWLGTWLTRGQVLRFRSWRWLHELRHPATDKRQAFRHTVGRVYRGNLYAPSGILAELAETKVPGEPLYCSTESGWRPYLPLVDELLSCLDQWDRRLRRYTSEGVTEIIAPPALWRRLWARTVLTARFAGYARLRNWQEGAQADPSSYLAAVAQLGFAIRFVPYPAAEGFPETTDPLVQRFFPEPAPSAVAISTGIQEAAAAPLWVGSGQALALWPLGDWSSLWERFRDYFFSVYQNSLFDLGVFLAALGGLFFGRHIVVNALIRRARNRLPLSIGGWGTRGKSGTERLKAALVNALGFGVMSKTTGCEAMFLHADPYGTLREMFLYRPYDKATIWEQANVLRLSEHLHVEVFLWECMGLTPAYVFTLQRQWMRDDLATITNTYPDHEDVQGPAGYNIPEVMTNFIPRRSTLLTSEEQMLPILRDAAGRLGSRLRTVGWLEAGLLTPDVLARFPYEEHPYNIALVLALAEELGVERDYALKEMADRVVMDIGVLKKYPAAWVRGRRLEFINGMSANERFGCLNNWVRMGFDRQDRYEEPSVWITTVVNNRADRIPRSRVFAGILVNDVSADRHFLIGTNLDGLQGYIREAWEPYIAGLRLWPATAGAESAERILERQARWQRIPTEEQYLRERLVALLRGLDIADVPEPPAGFWRESAALRDYLTAAGAAEHGEAIAAHLLEEGQCYEEYRALAERVAAAEPAGRPALEATFHDQLWRWFSRKLVVIRDPHASGEQIIDRIVRETPPGLLNRIMGMQNIKGPGLNFVYRWQAWQDCHDACQRLSDPDLATARQGLRELAGLQAFGQLSEQRVQETVSTVRHRPVAQSEQFQAELTLIESRLEQAAAAVKTQLQTNLGGQPDRLARLLGTIEAFLDAGDAVKRRKLADRIYRDLAEERIGHQRAALELQALTQRQKGGWLEKRVRAWLAALREGRGDGVSS
ncbi:MAG: HEAT repeat domain-containing protein [Candidatus Competibacter sp.]